MGLREEEQKEEQQHRQRGQVVALTAIARDRDGLLPVVIPKRTQQQDEIPIERSVYFLYFDLHSPT